MTEISLIAAVDEKGGLGYKNQLLCHLPADLKHFKAVTEGKPVIMGRKTLESIGRALPNRLNIVLTSRPDLDIEGVSIAHSLDEALLKAAGFPEIMIIGGSALFSEGMKIASRIYLTRIHHAFKADVFFPEIDVSNWSCRLTEKRMADEKNLYDMSFYIYQKKQKK